MPLPLLISRRRTAKGLPPPHRGLVQGMRAFPRAFTSRRFSPWGSPCRSESDVACAGRPSKRARSKNSIARITEPCLLVDMASFNEMQRAALQQARRGGQARQRHWPPSWPSRTTASIIGASKRSPVPPLSSHVLRVSIGLGAKLRRLRGARLEDGHQTVRVRGTEPAQRRM